MLRVVEDVIAMHGLLWPDEIRAPEGVAPDADVTVRDKELDLADALMDTLGEVDIAELHDDYREAVEEMIAAKARARGVRAAPRRGEGRRQGHRPDGRAGEAACGRRRTRGAERRRHGQGRARGGHPDQGPQEDGRVQGGGEEDRRVEDGGGQEGGVGDGEEGDRDQDRDVEDRDEGPVESGGGQEGDSGDEEDGRVEDGREDSGEEDDEGLAEEARLGVRGRVPAPPQAPPGRKPFPAPAS